MGILWPSSLVVVPSSRVVVVSYPSRMSVSIAVIFGSSNVRSSRSLDTIECAHICFELGSVMDIVNGRNNQHLVHEDVSELDDVCGKILFMKF